MKNEMVIIPVEGEITRKECAKVPEYLELKAGLNGGMLETVPYFNKFEDEQCVAFCDEEGKIKNLDFNSRANLLWIKQTRHLGFQLNDILVGPVVIIKGSREFLSEL